MAATVGPAPEGMSESWSKGSTRAWRRIRAGVLARDGYECQLRIDGVCTGRAHHAHHVRGRAVTGDDPRWIVAACAACNLNVGDPTRAADPPNEGVTQW